MIGGVDKGKKHVSTRYFTFTKCAQTESLTPYRVKDREAFIKNRIFRYKSGLSEIDVMKGISES